VERDLWKTIPLGIFMIPAIGYLVLPFLMFFPKQIPVRCQSSDVRMMHFEEDVELRRETRLVILKHMEKQLISVVGQQQCHLMLSLLEKMKNGIMKIVDHWRQVPFNDLVKKLTNQSDISHDAGIGANNNSPDGASNTISKRSTNTNSKRAIDPDPRKFLFGSEDVTSSVDWMNDEKTLESFQKAFGFDSLSSDLLGTLYTYHYCPSYPSIPILRSITMSKLKLLKEEIDKDDRYLTREGVIGLDSGELILAAHQRGIIMKNSNNNNIHLGHNLSARYVAMKIWLEMKEKVQLSMGSFFLLLGPILGDL